MSMTRDDAVAYVADSLGALLTEAGITPDSAGLGSAIDDALLLMGTPYDALQATEIDDADVIGYRAVLRYAALLKAQDALVTRVSTSISLGTPNVSKSTQGGQMATAIAARLEKAKAEAAPYLVAANDGAFSTGTVRLGAMTEGWP